MKDSFFVNKNKVITYWNKAAEQLSGFRADEVVGKACSDNILSHVDVDGNSLCANMCPLTETMTDGIPRDGVVYMHHKNGHRLAVSHRISILTDQSDNIIGGIELFTENGFQAELNVKKSKVTQVRSLTLCPKCNSEYTQLVHRKKLVKLLTKKNKHMCLDCGKQFYAKLSNSLVESSMTPKD